jgi:hypothetical protein
MLITESALCYSNILFNFPKAKIGLEKIKRGNRVSKQIIKISTGNLMQSATLSPIRSK